MLRFDAFIRVSLAAVLCPAILSSAAPLAHAGQFIEAIKYSISVQPIDAPVAVADVITSTRSRLGNGDGTLRTAQSIAGGAQIAVDLNGDGYPDVANANFWNSSVTVELNKGNAQPK